MKRTGSTDMNVRKLLVSLKGHEKAFWNYVGEELDKPRRKMSEVNVYKINSLTKANDIVVVPGKVLGVGFLDHPVTVAALSFSKSAQQKINQAGGKIMSINKALEEIKDFKNNSVRLMK